MQVCFNKPHRINPSVRQADTLTGLGLLPTGHVSLQSQVPECDPLPRETRPWDFPHGKGRALGAPDSAGLRVSLGASPTGTNPTSHNASCRSSCLQ